MNSEEWTKSRHYELQERVLNTILSQTMTLLPVTSIGPSLFLSPLLWTLWRWTCPSLSASASAGKNNCLEFVTIEREWCTSAVEHKGLTATERRLSSRSNTLGQIAFLASDFNLQATLHKHLRLISIFGLEVCCVIVGNRSGPLSPLLPTE